MRRPLVLDSLMRRTPLGVSAVVLGLQHARNERFQTCEGRAHVAIELRPLVVAGVGMHCVPGLLHSA